MNWCPQYDLLNLANEILSITGTFFTGALNEKSLKLDISGYRSEVEIV